MKLEYEVYKAFILSEKINELENFNKISIDNEYNLLVSDDYEYHKVESDENMILLFGYCHDIRDSKKSIEQVLSNLIDFPVGDDLYKEMEYLNGRFTLLVKNLDDVYVYSDATNLRSMFYHKDLKVISSHEYLIKEYAKQYHDADLTQRLFNKGEADWTNSKMIFKFSPSVELNLNSFEFKRIFPRVDRVEQSPEQAMTAVQPYLAEIISWLGQQENLKFSLTGGLDSRVSLSVLKPIINNIKTFTYLKSEKLLSTSDSSVGVSYSNDERISKDIAFNLNLDHRSFYIPESLKEDRAYSRKMSVTMSSKHSYKLSYYLNNQEDFRNSLHIKSTVSSVSKSSFPKELYDENNLDALLKGFKKWAPKELKSYNNREQYRAEMISYLKRIDIDMEDLKGYHILDLIFLESRLGNFQSNITQETDNTLEVYNLFNSRKLIEILLSVPLDDRQGQVLPLLIIENNWPVLNQFSMNESIGSRDVTKYFLETIIDTTSRDLYTEHGLLKCGNKSLVLNKLGNGFLIEPETVPLKADEKHFIQFLNIYDSPVSIKLYSEYENEKARGTISFSFNDEVLDLLDMNKGIPITLESHESIDIEMIMNATKTSMSWRKAARIYIDMVEESQG